MEGLSANFEFPTVYQEFVDIHLLASSHPLIKMSYRQADRGRFQGSILAFPLPHGLLWQSRANVGGPGLGHIPEGYLMVGMCTRGNSEKWHGRDTQVGVASYGVGLNHRAPADHDAICWMLHWDYVHRVSEQLGIAIPGLFGSDPWLSLPEDRLRPYRTTLLEFSAEASRRGGLTGELGRWFEEYLIFRFLEMLTQFSPLPAVRSSNGELAQNLARAIESQCTGPLCLAELCARFHLHERTLRYHFVSHYGMSPTAYHQCYRLNLLRQQLLLAMPQRGEVGRLAAQLGFWHLGRLGQQYRRLFGESPAETLLRRPSQEFQKFWFAYQQRRAAAAADVA